MFSNFQSLLSGFYLILIAFPISKDNMQYQLQIRLWGTCIYSCLFPHQLCFMEARHCLSAANVIFSQTGKNPATEDSKFVCMFYYM